MIIFYLISPNNGFCTSDNENATVHEIFRLIKLAYNDDANFSEAIQLEHEAIKLSKQISCDSCLAKSYYYLGATFYYNSMLDSAFVYFDTIIDFYKKSNDVKQLADIYEFLAYANRDIHNNKKAIEYARLGLNIVDSLGLIAKTADFYLFIGSVDVEDMPDKEQIEALANALYIYEKENDSINISYALINLGVLFSNDNNNTEAYDYTSRALRINQNIGNKHGVSVCLNNLGDISLSTKEYDKALNFFLRSMEIDKALGDTEGEAICLFNIGDSYKEMKDTVLAVSYYTKSIDISVAYNYSIAGVTYIKLGEIFLGEGRLRLALKYANDGFDILKLNNNRIDMVSAYELLHKCSAAMGNYEQAYNYFILCKQIMDSTFSIDKSKNIQKIISTYNDEKQKTEIITLKEKRTIDSRFRSHLIITIVTISFVLVILFFAVLYIRRSKINEKKQKLYYEKLLDRSEDFIFVISKEGKNKYISPSYQRKIGWGVKDNWLGNNSFEDIHPDDVEQVKKVFEKLVEDGKSCNIEFRIRNTNNTWVDVAAYGQNLLEDTTIEGIVVNFWDITQRKKNDILIKENEAKFRQIFNSFPDIYFEADLTGMVTEISPSVEKITGYTSNEIIGLHPSEYKTIIGDWNRIGAKFKLDSQINDFDTKVIIKNGSHIYCSLSAELIVYNDNKPTGIKGVVRDISNRVISQKRLLESQRNLKKANKSKELLFSIISHDLIGPIGTNKSIVDLIVGNIDEFSHEEIVSLITSLKPSLDSTFSLIENLLSWARIQQDRLKPSFENISINKMVNEIVLLLDTQAQRKSITLKIIENKSITVLADKNQLDVALRNLVSNAIKFSNQNDEVIISLDTSDDMAVIKVIDNGIGLSANQIDDILIKEGSTKVKRGTDNEKGTGFGLIIVNEFVKNNKGNLNIQSKVGEGTTFVVELPLKK